MLLPALLLLLLSTVERCVNMARSPSHRSNK
jgi:hypothetical protein